MWMQTSATESYYSPLPPEVVLHRLAACTAQVTIAANGWGTSRRSQPFHEFEGTIGADFFTISRLPSTSLGLHAYQFSLPAQPPEVVGTLTADPTGGTCIQLCYQAITIGWGQLILGSMIVAWVKGVFALSKLTVGQVGQAVAIVGLMALGAWVARPASLWVRRRELRPRLADLLSLRAATP